MRVRTLSKDTLLLVKATLLVASCLTVLSVVRPANAQTTGNAAGNNNGIWWTIYTEGGSSGYAAITPGANGGQYSGSWRDFKGNFTMGTGWTGNNSGSTYYKSAVNANAINYVGYNIGAYSDNKKGSVAVYGKVNADASNPLVEYYIVERWNPAYPIPGEGTKMNSSPVEIKYGSVSTFYNIWKVNKSWGVQYFSVRTSQAPLNTSITVPVSQHFAAWENLGMRTTKNRQTLFLSTESLYQGPRTTDRSTGNINATVWGW